MNNIDQKIQAALRGHTGGDALATEPNFTEELIVAFRGRHRGLSALAVVFSLGLFALLLWAGFRFQAAETVRAQLMWGGIGLWAVLAIGFIKIWFWIELHSNRVLRELKRVELLLVSRSPGN